MCELKRIILMASEQYHHVLKVRFDKQKNKKKCEPAKSPSLFFNRQQIHFYICSYLCLKVDKIVMGNTNMAIRCVTSRGLDIPKKKKSSKQQAALIHLLDYAVWKDEHPHAID